MTRWLTIPVIGGLAVWAFPTMADAASKGTCLLALVLAGEVALRRRGAAMRHLLLVAAFGLLLALPVLTLILPGWQVLPTWMEIPPVEDAAAAAESEPPSSPVEVLPRNVMEPGPQVGLPEPTMVVGGGSAEQFVFQPAAPLVETEWSALPVGAGGSEIVSEAPATDTGVISRTARNACVLVWLAGTVLLLLRLLFGAGLIRHARRRATVVTDGPLHQLLEELRSELGVRRPVRLYLGEQGAMPMAWGLWRACILVPRSMGNVGDSLRESPLRSVLLHELGHIARRDPLWQLIVELGRAVYWFHPLVWLAAWRVHVERERACDDLVISRGVAAKDYARHLLDVVSRGRLRTVRPAIGVAMASTGRIEGRVRSILDDRRNRRPLTRTVGAVGLVASVAVGLPLAMMQAADDPVDDTDPPEVAENVQSAVPEPTTKDTQPDDGLVEPASLEEVTRRVRELLYVLRRHRVFSRSDYWGGAIRELIEIGEPAVPELVAELDRSDRDETLSALGFALRGIGDPRAVPALIRNIPKLLRSPRSDYGIHIHDPDLRAFLKQFERYQNDDDYVSYGRPVNELLDALEKLTGHSEPADSENDPLRHVMLRGNAQQREAAREQYAERQAHWEQWWDEHRDEFVTADALATLELPPQEGDAIDEAGLARFGPMFPTGPDVRLGPVREIELDSYSYWDAPSHFDFDTGRVYQYLEGAGDVEPETPDDMFSVVVSWPAEMGIDIRLNEGEDLHVWQIEDDRWDTIEEEIESGQPLQLGPEATDWLVKFVGGRADFQYDQMGTFLITTREGGRGIVQSHPRDVLTGKIKLRYRMWMDGRDEPPPPHEHRRERTGPAFGEPVAVTLQTPGRGKSFLLNLATGEAVRPPDVVVPADAGGQFWFGDSEAFVDWCRDNEIDLAAHLTQFESEGAGGSGVRVGLIGLGMMERHVLPSAFDEMTVREAREILDRYPERREHTFLSPTADIPHQPDTFVLETRGGRLALLRIWESAEDGSSVTIHYRPAPEQPNARRGAAAGTDDASVTASEAGSDPADADDASRESVSEDEPDQYDSDPLDHRVSLAADEVPLREALAEICRQAGVTLDLDSVSLAESGFEPDKPVTTVFQEVPLHEALGILIDWNTHPTVYREIRHGKLVLSTLAARERRIRENLPEWLEPLYGRGISASLDEDDNVARVYLGHVATDELLAQLATLPDLRELEMGYTRNLTPAGLAHLGEFPNLERLELNDVNAEEGLGDDAIQSILSLTSLRELKLNECGTTDAGVQLLESMQQLTRLTLRQEGLLTDAALGSIARLEHLKHLDLTSHVGTDRLGWMRFSPEALNQLSALEELESLMLPGHDIEGPGFSIPRLKSLYVCGSHVDDDMASAVTECPRLERLTLDRTLVTDAGLQQIAALPELRYLKILRGNFTDTGISYLANASRIEHLVLHDLALTDLLVDQLAGIVSLTRVEISPADRSNIALLERLGRLPRLRMLLLRIPSGPLLGGGFISSEELRQREMQAVEAVRPEVEALHQRLPDTRIVIGTEGRVLEQWGN